MLSVLAVFQFVALARILFRAGSIADAGDFVTALTDFSTTYTPLSWIGVATLLTAALLHYTPSRWSYDWKALYTRLPWPVQSGIVVATIYLLVALSPGQAPFVYFQF